MAAGRWDAWLRKVERIGFCSLYQKALDENFDSKEQLEQLYVKPGPGFRVLDPSFFEDIGVLHEEHRRHFTEYLTRPSAALRASSELHTAAKPATASAAAEPRVDSSAGKAFVGRSCAAWLDEVGVDKAAYAQILEDNFDAVDQILVAYVSTSDGEFDMDAFSTDVGVANARDQERFRSWFHGKLRGSQAKAASPPSQPSGSPPAAPVAAAPVAAAPASVPAPPEAGLGQFAAWLAEADPSGGLRRYLRDIEDNYDDVNQIEELYVISEGGEQTVDPQLFSDLGVEDEGHRALFVRHLTGGGAAPGPAAPREVPAESPGKPQQAPAEAPLPPSQPSGSPPAAPVAAAPASAPAPPEAGLGQFAAWLAEADPSGGLRRYLRDIEDNYDDVNQIEELYVISEGGETKVDPQLFSDLGIEDEGHQALFVRHLTRGEAAPVPAAPQEVAAEPPAKPQGEGHHPTPSAEPAAPAAGPGGFADWLKRVDPGGSLGCYLKDFEDNYDGIDQIDDLYVVEAAGKKTLDAHFFEDMGIEDAGHQALFTRYFCGGAAPELASPPPAQPQCLTFTDWLKQIDPSGGLGSYHADLEENYDGCSQIEELYVTKVEGRKVLDPQFFADMGVDDKSHQLLFTKYLTRP